MAKVAADGTPGGRIGWLGGSEGAPAPTPRRSLRVLADEPPQPSPGGMLDVVCGMTVEPATAKHRAEHAGSELLLLLRLVQDEVQSAIPAKFLGGHRRGNGRAVRPTASRRGRSGSARCTRRSRATGRAPVRSAAWRSSRAGDALDDGAEPRARRHAAALLDLRCRCAAAALRAGDGGHGARRSARTGCSRAQRSRTGCSSRSRRRWCCGAAGRSSCAAGLGANRGTQHVHADRARHRRRLRLQRRRHACARACFPASFRGHDGARRRSTSRPRR